MNQFTYSRRVQFAETDMAGILHFSNYARYMEECEHAFFRALGRSIHEDFEDHAHGWPRVHFSCDYLAPLRFEDEVTIQLLIREIRPKVLRFGFIFRKDDKVVARGKIITVHTVLDKIGGTFKAAPMPDELFRLLEPAPNTAFQQGGFPDGEW